MLLRTFKIWPSPLAERFCILCENVPAAQLAMNLARSVWLFVVKGLDKISIIEGMMRRSELTLKAKPVRRRIIPSWTKPGVAGEAFGN